MYLDIHNHGVRKEGCVVSMTPDEFVQYGESGPGFVSIGLHPWDLESRTLEQQFAMVESAVSRNLVVAVGECGVDRRKSTFSIQDQLRVFERHVVLAESYNLPVIIHSVRAFADIVSVRKRHKKTPWMIHGFIGNRQEIAQCERHEIRLSPGIALLRMNGILDHPLLGLLKEMNRDMLYLETDGVRSVRIDSIYSLVSERLECSVEDLQNQILMNFYRDFGVRLNGVVAHVA